MAEIENLNSQSQARRVDANSVQALHNELLESISNYNIEQGWVRLEDPEMVNLILRTYGDGQNRRILSFATHMPRTVMEIINDSKMPQTSTYRRILRLKREYFLIPDSSEQKIGRTRNESYLSAIQDLRVDMRSNGKIILMAKFTKYSTSFKSL